MAIDPKVALVAELAIRLYTLRDATWSLTIGDKLTASGRELVEEALTLVEYVEGEVFSAATTVDPSGLQEANKEHARQVYEFGCDPTTIRPKVIRAYLDAQTK